jgi:hypothetical protein
MLMREMHDHWEVIIGVHRVLNTGLLLVLRRTCSRWKNLCQMDLRCLLTTFLLNKREQGGVKALTVNSVLTECC